MPAPYNSVLTKPDNLYTNLSFSLTFNRPRGLLPWGD